MSTAVNTPNNSTQETEDGDLREDHGSLKFSASHETLLSRLLLVGRAVSTRSTMPSLGGILVTAADGSVGLRATDTEVALSLELDAEVEAAGSSLLPGRLLVDVVRSLPAGEQVSARAAPGAARRRDHRRLVALSPPHARRPTTSRGSPRWRATR